MRRCALLPAVWFALAVTLTATGPPAFGQADAEPADPQPEIERLREENAALRARIAELEQRLAALTERHDQLAARKQSLEKRTADRAAEQRAYYLDSTYDAEADRTHITSRPLPLRTERGSEWRHHWLRFAAARDGRDGPVRTVRMRLEAFATGKIYDDVDVITFTGTDDTPIAAEVVEYDNQFRTSGGYKNRRRVDDETLVAELTLDQLRELAALSQPTGRIGTRDFRLARDHVRAARALLGELSDNGG